jgi:hypothetical protein
MDTKQSQYGTAIVSTSLFAVLYPLLAHFIFGKQFDFIGWAITVVLFLIFMLAFARFRNSAES